MRWLSGLVAALCLAASAATAVARPYTVDDLLHEESLGAHAVDPTGRWFVFERRGPYDRAPAYDYDHQVPAALSTLFVVDLEHGGPARPLLTGPDRSGVVLGAFSPSGRRLAVFRLNRHSWTLGVLTLATGAVRWFDFAPDQAVFGRTLQWLSDTELLTIERPDRTSAFALRVGHLSADVLPARWRATAEGRGAWTVLGSGALSAVRPRPTPRRLLRVDVLTGRRQILASGELTDLEISPDRRHVALLFAGADIQPHADQPLQGDWGIETQRTDLSILDLRTGARTGPCVACDLLPLLLAWSPSGRNLLVFSREAGRPWSGGALKVIDPDSGAVHPRGAELTPPLEGRPEYIRAGWMGENPVVFAHPRGATRDDWYRLSPDGDINLTARAPTAPRTLQALDARGLAAVVDGVLWRFDPTGRADAGAAPVEALREARSGVQTRPSYVLPGASWVLSRKRGMATIARVDMSAMHAVTEVPDDSGVLWGASEAASAAIIRALDGHRVERLMLRRAGHPSFAVATLNAGLSAIDMPSVHAIAHRGPAGQPLTSWLFLPPRPPGSPPPPLLVKVYSGDNYRTPPVDLAPPNGLLTNIRTLTGQGYAVLTPSLPWPPTHGEPMAGLADRILEVVDQAAADPALAGAFDIHRMALWGHSFGGYTVLAAIGQTDRFRAAISLAGMSDLASVWGAFGGAFGVLPEEGVHTAWTGGWVESSQGDMGAPPWADPQRYIRNSPLFAAGKIVTPLLQVHGDQDDFELGQANAMFSALYRQNKDAELVTYWGEGHLIVSPGNVRDFFRRTFGFLDRELGSVRPTAEALDRSRAPESASGAPTTRPRRR